MAQVGLNARPLRAFRPLVRDDRRQIRCARCMVSFTNSPIAATRTRAARRRSHYHVPPLLLERCRQVRMRPWRELVSHRTASNPLADWPVIYMCTARDCSPEAPESGLWIRRNVFGQGRTLTRGQGAERLRRSVPDPERVPPERSPEFFETRPSTPTTRTHQVSNGNPPAGRALSNAGNKFQGHRR